MTTQKREGRENAADKFRVKYMEGDYRRDPKTEHYCCRCQKDLKPGQPYRVVHLVDGGPCILHPDDDQEYMAWSEAHPGGQHPGELGCHPIGSDCAKKVGIEWTHDAPITGGRS